MAKQPKTNKKRVVQPRVPVDVVRYIQNVDQTAVLAELVFVRHDGSIGSRLISRGELRMSGKVCEVLDAEGVNYDEADLKHLRAAHTIDSDKVRYGYTDVGWRPSGRFGLPRRRIRENGHLLSLMPVSEASALALFESHAGDLAEWNISVVPALSASSFAIFAVGVAFAAPLLKFSKSTEGATFAFSGGEGVGKTTCCAAAQAVMGTPERHLLTNWDGSRSGFNDVFGDTNDTVIIIDDTSRDNLPASERLRLWGDVGHAIAGGGKRSLSRNYMATQSPAVTRRPSLALTSGEIAPDELAQLTGAKLMGGVRVRFIDIPVPAKEAGGVFDLAVADVPADEVEDTAAAAAETSNTAIGTTFGVAFNPYLDYLEERHDKLALRVERTEKSFLKITKQARKGKPVSQRFVRKFGLVLAGLKQAIRAGVLTLTPKQALQAVQVCLEAALRRQDQEGKERRLQVRALAGLLGDASRVPRLKRRQTPSPLSMGFRRILKGDDIAYVQAQRIGEALQLDEAAVSELISHLVSKGALLPGTGSDRTRPVKVGGKQIRHYAFRIAFFLKKVKPKATATAKKARRKAE